MIEIPEKEVIETEKSWNWLNDGILYSVAKEKAYLDLSAAIAIREAFQELVDKPTPLFVDLHLTTGQSTEARNFFSNDPEHISLLTAVALVATNPVARVVGNIYMGLVVPKIPTKLFGNKESALEWLLPYKNNG